MSRRLLLLLLLTAGTAAAQEVSTAIVPVVGSVFGATMVHWKTDVEIVNDTGRPLDVGVEMPCAPGSPAIVLTLGAGETQRFTDITGQAFGLDRVLSPLRVTTEGRRSVSVRASVYAMREGSAEVSPAQPLAVYTGQAYYPTRMLDNLAFSDQFRTNIGLVNLGDKEADFVMALERIPGRTMAVTRVRVNAGSMVHNSIQSLFPLISEGSGFTVIVETGSRETYVYGSVIESANHSGRFVPARVGAR
ncbi:MAG: hypothetical protein ABI779_13295 [Acidobacteriota bacterium]